MWASRGHGARRSARQRAAVVSRLPLQHYLARDDLLGLKVARLSVRTRTSFAWSIALLQHRCAGGQQG